MQFTVPWSLLSCSHLALMILWAVQAPWQQAVAMDQSSAGSSKPADDQTINMSGGRASDGFRGHHQPVSYAPEPRTIGQVVLVGGGTKASVIQSYVEGLTGVEAIKGIDPAAVVAFGCAMYAGMLMGDAHGCEMVDGSFAVDSHSRVTGF